MKKACGIHAEINKQFFARPEIDCSGFTNCHFERRRTRPHIDYRNIPLRFSQTYLTLEPVLMDVLCCLLQGGPELTIKTGQTAPYPVSTIKCLGKSPYWLLAC